MTLAQYRSMYVYTVHTFILAYTHKNYYIHIRIHRRIATQVLVTVFKVDVKFNLQYTKR